MVANSNSVGRFAPVLSDFPGGSVANGRWCAALVREARPSPLALPLGALASADRTTRRAPSLLRSLVFSRSARSIVHAPPFAACAHVFFPRCADGGPAPLWPVAPLALLRVARARTAARAMTAALVTSAAWRLRCHWRPASASAWKRTSRATWRVLWKAAAPSTSLSRLCTATSTASIAMLDQAQLTSTRTADRRRAGHALLQRGGGQLLQGDTVLMRLHLVVNTEHKLLLCAICGSLQGVTWDRHVQGLHPDRYTAPTKEQRAHVKGALTAHARRVPGPRARLGWRRGHADLRGCAVLRVRVCDDLG